MLDNTAKISEIITALENMQGLNQKADLKSALIAKGINALDTDGVANLIAKLNSANLVLNGKRFATGTRTIVETGTTQLEVQIRGLSFTPSKVIVNSYYRNVRGWETMSIEVSSSTKDIYDQYGRYTYGVNGDKGTGNSGSIGQDYDNSRITENGFDIIISDRNRDITLKYWAFE